MRDVLKHCCTFANLSSPFKSINIHQMPAFVRDIDLNLRESWQETDLIFKRLKMP